MQNFSCLDINISGLKTGPIYHTSKEMKDFLQPEVRTWLTAVSPSAHREG